MAHLIDHTRAISADLRGAEDGVLRPKGLLQDGLGSVTSNDWSLHGASWEVGAGEHRLMSSQPRRGVVLKGRDSNWRRLLWG